MARIGRWILIILGFIVFAVAAYFVYQNFFAAGDPEPVVDLGSIVTLECDTDCAAYGQCGTNMNDDLPVILAGKDQIMLEQQDLTLPVAVDMFITAKNKAKVKVYPWGADQETKDAGEEMEVQFWKLGPNGIPPEDKQEGWVADWCVKAKTNE